LREDNQRQNSTIENLRKHSDEIKVELMMNELALMESKQKLQVRKNRFS